MPLQKLQFRPGVNRESTTLANEGGWYDCNNIRFRSGYPEKIGGWVADVGQTSSALKPPSLPAPYNPASFWGVCRNLWAWLNLAGYNLLGLGTNLKYYIQNGIGGAFNDVTPIRYTTSAGAVTFTTTAGSKTVTVTNTGNGVQANDFVTFSGATSTDATLTAAYLNAEFQVQKVLTNTTYTILAPVAATSSGSQGGSSTVGAYQITTGSDIYTTAVGWGAGGWGGYNGGDVITTLGTTIASSGAVTTITVSSTTGFGSTGVVWIGNEGFSYSGTTSTTFTGVTRAYGNTPLAQHLSGVTVTQYPSVSTGWGLSAPAGLGLGVQLRLWTSANYGQDLIINPAGSSLYYWAVNSNPSIYNRAQYMAPGGSITTSAGTFNVDSSCPNLVNFVIVSDASDFVIALGCNDPSGTVLGTQFESVLDPLAVRWTDQQAAGTWLPSATNQAGSYRLSQGSQIVTAVQTRQEILILTDSAIYSMQYLGPPYVWGFQIMGDNMSIMGPNAIVSVNNITYWMGYNKFYIYSGTVSTLPCAVRQYVFDNINLTQSNQVFAGTNEAYNEIIWYYCSNNSSVVDSYVIFNYLDQTWYYGQTNSYNNVGRTSWLYSPLRQNPMATAYGSLLVYHEESVDDGTTNPPSPIDAYVQSSDFDIGDGNNFGFVWRVVPDVNFTGSYTNNPTVNLTLLPRQNPGTGYGQSNDPTVVSAQNYTNQREYIVQQFTPQIYVRARGRQMAIKLESTTLGTQWQLGVPRIDARPDGRR